MSDEAGSAYDHPLVAARLEKVEAMRAAGVEPYPVNFERTATAAELHQRFTNLEPGASTGQRVAVAGRLMNLRIATAHTFGVLRDGSGTIQLFVDADFRRKDDLEHLHHLVSLAFPNASAPLVEPELDLKEGAPSRLRPDLLVTDADGSQYVVEIKQSARSAQAVDQLRALRNYLVHSDSYSYAVVAPEGLTSLPGSVDGIEIKPVPFAAADLKRRFQDLDAGDWIGAEGEVITTRRGELSVRVESFQLLAKGLRPLPEKWHGLADVEKRHRLRYVDLLVNEASRRTMQARVATVASLRESLTNRGFVEVETPVLHNVPSGGLAHPFRTHHEALGIDMFLRIALELHLKRMIVGGVERVFEIGRVFRNEGVSPRHNPEFTMLELYQALADYEDMATLTEELVVEAANRVAGTTELTFQGRPLSVATPWRRITYFGGISDATGDAWDPGMPLEEARRLSGRAGVEPQPAWGVGKIAAEVFEARVEPDLWEPAIVMDYPKEISPLAREHRSKPDLVERFEVIVAGNELANAFSELNDPVEQRRRFEAQMEARAAGDTEAHPMDEDFLRALEYGMPPTGGMGLGVDRLVMLLTDQASIREVVLFPHLRPE